LYVIGIFKMLTHIGLIMDGNRRWARSQGLPSVAGHREGVKVVERVTQYALENKIKYLTFYAFSLENFKRTEEEKAYLFDLVADGIKSYAHKFMEHGIRVNFVGDRALFPPSIQRSSEEIEQLTAKNDSVIVNILFCYGGQQEIVAAARSLVQQASQGKITEKDITPECFVRELWSGNCLAPDLVIRTGGMHRLSNFLLYLSAYSELIFTDTFWPAFTNEELDSIIYNYNFIKRNFGS